MEAGGLGELWREIVGHEGGLTFLVAGLYFVGAVAVRWMLIAEPYRHFLRSRADCVRAQLPLLEGVGERSGEVTALLDAALQDLESRELVVWGRGRERAAASKVMCAERMLARFLPDDEAVAHALVVASQLEGFPADRRPGQLLAALHHHLDRCEDEAARTERLTRIRALAEQGLVLLHEEANGRAADHLAFHRKTFWLMTTAFLVTLAVAAVLGGAVLLLVGALGAVVSRLFLLVRSREVPRDYATLWTTLLLSPFVGALAAYGGLLLVALLVQLDVLGGVVDGVAWDGR